MQIHTTIFSYERENMLKALVEEIKAFSSVNISYKIIDDGSSFTFPDNFHQFEHGGKEKFYQLWSYALSGLQNAPFDLFLFLPSDVSNVDFDRIIELHNQFKDKPYAYNLINDGRTKCWNLIEPKQIDEHTLKVGFTDCGFFCNKQLLNKIGYYVDPINPARFVNPAISSGVGQQLTQRMNKAKCDIYLPVKSLVYHGSHPSVMHPQERIKTPLISK